MMMTLLVLKGKIKNFYEKHYLAARIPLKILIIFLSFVIMTTQMDYHEVLGDHRLLLGGAVLLGFVPDPVSIWVLLLFAILEVMQVSSFLAVTILAVVLIYFLVFGRLDHRQSYLLAAIPLLSAVHIGYAVPLVAALFCPPVLLPAVMMGIVLQFMFRAVGEYARAAAELAASEEPALAVRFLTDYLLQNKLMFVTIIAFVLTFLSIYAIRRGNVKRASQIAILVGGIVLMAVELLSDIMLDLDMNLAELTIGVLVCMGVAYMVQFFHITLDYHGTRKLQFEDDEYYYYVTAVPKFKVAVVDKTVTRIVPSEEEHFDLKEELEKALEEEVNVGDGSDL